MPLCPQCVEKMIEPGLRHALASVGIEHKLATTEMLRDFLEVYHANGHKESRVALHPDPP